MKNSREDREKRPLYLRAGFNAHVAQSSPPPFLQGERATSFITEAWVRAIAYTVGWLYDRPNTHRDIMWWYSPEGMKKRIRITNKSR